ncbi:MAG TPA: class I SAM-dependent methyltransferase [Chitinophagaceae bacterium]|nr:class I SAM-dependent methyltransferase [Chitinophagaceae bacterium]
MKRIEMYENGAYFEKNPTWDAADAVWKVQWIKKLLSKNTIEFNNVVDVGCGGGKLLQELCELYPEIKDWTGYDISPQAIDLARQMQDKRLSFFNEDFLSNDTKRAGLLLTIDVVEHVADYYGFLEKLKNKSDYFVFHIPLDLSCRTILKPHVMLQQREAVGHIHYFSKEMVLWMLKDTGYEIIDWDYTKLMIDLLPQASVKNKLKKILRKLSFSLNTDKSVKLWGGYSMMVLAK